MSLRSFRRAALAVTTPQSSPAMSILRHCAPPRHSKTIARSGRRSSRNSRSGRCLRPAFRARRRKPLPRSRAGSSPNSRARIALIKPEAGRVTARRLNRAEYNNTIRDLLGVDIRPADNFPGGHRGLRIRQHQRRAESLPGAAGKVCGCRRARGADRAVRAGAAEAAAMHYSAPVRINDSRGQSSLPKDLFHYDLTGLEHAPFRARHAPLSRSTASTASAWC